VIRRYSASSLAANGTCGQVPTIGIRSADHVGGHRDGIVKPLARHMCLKSEITLILLTPMEIGEDLI
jgi:hypothetical protein